MFNWLNQGIHSNSLFKSNVSDLTSQYFPKTDEQKLIKQNSMAYYRSLLVFFVHHIITIISVVELLPMRISIVKYVNYILFSFVGLLEYEWG